MQAVVLAGGLATRMRPRTLTTPKFLLEVAGRPFGAWLLERLAACGYDEVVLCIAHLGEQIRSFAGDGRQFGLRVSYADEGEKLLGTAGALRRALDQVELAPAFLVTYGDSYLPFDYAAPLKTLLAERPHRDADGVMAVYKNDGQWETSNTEVKKDEAGDLWIARYEKGREDATLHYIDYGATALHRDIIADLPPETPYGFDQIQRDLSRKGRLRAHLATRRFFEIGSVEGLAALEAELRR